MAKRKSFSLLFCHTTCVCKVCTYDGMDVYNTGRFIMYFEITKT